MTDGILRTKMGTYVLRDDTCLSRWVENECRLDLNANIVEIASFAHLIPEGGVVIDAGACIGDHAVTYSQIVGPHGVVYAFEPHPVSCDALRLNVARFRNVRVIECGLSDVNARASFSLDPNIGASFATDAPVNGGASIDVARLDDLGFLFSTRCDFMHLDLEGFETRAFRGAQNFIATFHPTLVFEVCDKHLRRAGSSEAELLGLVAEMGYRVLPIPSHTEPELRDVLAVWP